MQKHINTERNLFSEIHSNDIRVVCESIIPADQSIFWDAAARAVLKGAIAACIKAETATHAELWKRLNEPTEQLLEFLGTTPVGAEGTMVLLSSTKQAGCVMATLMSYVAWLDPDKSEAKQS